MMGRLKSLESLRKVADALDGNAIAIGGCDCMMLPTRLRMIAGEIEREIAKRYILLPVDADGEPIHIGDLIEYHGRDGVYRLHAQGVYVYSGGRLCGERCVMNERLGIWEPDKCSHVKSRTLEDALVEYAETIDVTSWKKAHDNRSLTVGEWEEIVRSEAEKCADEIRELMGGTE